MKEGYIVIKLLDGQPYRTLEDYEGQGIVAFLRDYDFIDVDFIINGENITRTFYVADAGVTFEILSTNVGEYMEERLREAIMFVEQLAPVYFGDKQVTGANLILEKREDGLGHYPTHFELVEE